MNKGRSWGLGGGDFDEGRGIVFGSNCLLKG